MDDLGTIFSLNNWPGHLSYVLIAVSYWLTNMAHIVLPKHPMPTIPLTKSELADLSAYILSLRDKD